MAGAYTPIEPDERPDDGSNALEFKSFLSGGTGNAAGTGNVNRGYLNDQPQQRSGFWTFDYYQQYFDVDTKTVLQRCVATLVPNSITGTFVATHLSPPDLYGPFWTLTTLIFALFITSSLASSIVAYLSDQPVQYNFQLLSIATTLVYAYGLGLPALLWISLRYIGVQEWGLVETVAVWGYGHFVWIPVAVLCIIPVPLLRWILVGLALGFSGFFLLTNIYPVLATAEAKATRLIIILIALLHTALAVTFKVLFFSYYVVKEIGVKDPLGDPAVPTGTTTANPTL